MTEIKLKPDGHYPEMPMAKSAPITLQQMASAAAQEQALLNKMASTLPHDVLSDILLSAGFKATEQNLNMLQMLMDNGLPLTQENISRMNQALKLSTQPNGAPDPARALFMILNNMKLSPANAATLNSVVSGATNITHQINNLLQAIAQLDDPALVTQLTKMLTEAAPQGQLPSPPTAPMLDASGQPIPAQNIPQGAQNAQPLPGATPDTALPQQTQPAASAATPQGAQPDAAQPQPGMAQPDGAQPAATQPGTPQPGAAQPVPDGAQPAGSAATPQGAPPAQATPAQSAPGQPQATEPQPGQPQTAQPTPASAQPAPNAATAASGGTANTPPPPLPAPLTFRILENTPADIDRFINHLRESLGQVRQTLTAQADPATPEGRVLQEARTLANHIEFTAQIRNQLYLQFPLLSDGHQTETTLHVFKDTKKQADGKKDTASALVALDTASLGHFETYVQKSSNSVHCQFRLDSPQVEQLVRDNVHRLEALLKNHGYSLGSFAFAAAGKPFTLLDSPAIFDENFQIDCPDNTLPQFDKKA